jgi:hypothetical protein
MPVISNFLKDNVYMNSLHTVEKLKAESTPAVEIAAVMQKFESLSQNGNGCTEITSFLQK